MGVPREMLVKEYSKVLASVVGVQEVPAEVNREGRKRAQILPGSEGEKFELRDVNFETIAVKIAAKRRESEFHASDKRWQTRFGF